jgi:hypothetical protein
MKKGDNHRKLCKVVFLVVYILFFSVQLFLQFSSLYLNGNSIAYNSHAQKSAVVKKSSDQVLIVKIRLNKHFESESLATIIPAYSFITAVFVPTRNSFYRPDILPERITDYASYRGPPARLS